MGFYSTGPKIKENDLQVGERTQQQQHPTPPQAAVAGVLDRGGMPWRGGLPIGGGAWLCDVTTGGRAVPPVLLEPCVRDHRRASRRGGHPGDRLPLQGGGRAGRT